MDTEFIIKLVTVAGAMLGLLHFSTTRRSVGYQNSKIQMELLSQSIAAHETEPDFKRFLIDVRKEKISFLVFGVPIPNADIERVITYYVKAEGKVTTGDIAAAWQYRDPSAGPLSFQLRGSFKRHYIGTNVYAVFCMIAAFVGILAVMSKYEVKQAIVLVCVSVVSFVLVNLMSQGLFTAERLAKLEKQATAQVAPTVGD